MQQKVAIATSFFTHCWSTAGSFLTEKRELISHTTWYFAKHCFNNREKDIFFLHSLSVGFRMPLCSCAAFTLWNPLDQTLPSLMGMHWPPGEWGESDTAYYKGQISLQLLDHKIETVSFTRLPAYRTMRFNLKELCCFETCKWNHMKTQYIISIIVNLIACSAVFWKHVWVSLQGVRLCYSNFGTTGGNTQCFRGTSPQLEP